VVIDRIYRVSAVALAVVCFAVSAALYIADGAGTAALGFIGLTLFAAGVLMEQVSR
jgi:hypothetical protein